MKKILKVVAGVALAGCMLVPLAACSDTNDNSKEVKQLQQQVQDLQTEINSLKNGNGGNDLFTGSPKFEYSLNETIPYYINGTKIFDFKITSLEYSKFDNASVAKYNVTFIPSFNVKPSEVFSAVVYNVPQNTFVVPYTFNDTGIAFTDNSGNQKTIILFYYGSPFASVTATPTQM